jgi:hypothetical protein
MIENYERELFEAADEFDFNIVCSTISIIVKVDVGDANFRD